MSLQLEKQRKGHGALGHLSRDEIEASHVYAEGVWSVVQPTGTSSTDDLMQDLAATPADAGCLRSAAVKGLTQMVFARCSGVEKNSQYFGC